MSPAAIGAFFGGLAILWLVTSGLLSILRRWLPEVVGICLASVLALSIATVLGGFGFADNGPPKFGYSFSTYLLPQLTVLILLLVRWGRARKEPQSLESEITAPAPSVVQSWPATLVAACILGAAVLVISYYVYENSSDGISYAVGGAIGSLLAGLLLAWFARRWFREYWTAAAILFASAALIASNAGELSEAFDVREAKQLLAATENASQVYLTARQHPSNRFLQMFSAVISKAEQAERRAEQLAEGLEPAGIAQEPTPGSATRSDLERYRALLKEAETRSRQANAQYAAILAQERADVIAEIGTHTTASRANYLKSALKGIDARHQSSRALADKLFSARVEVYAAYGKAYDFMIAQYGQFRFQGGKFLFVDQPTADRWSALIADYNAATKRLQAVSLQLEESQKQQSAQWQRAMRD